jgi:hypothetical protein
LPTCDSALHQARDPLEFGPTKSDRQEGRWARQAKN